MKDMIYRQDAIDALQKEINKGIPPFDDVMGSIRCGVRLARNIIEDLPSAEPEIIRCKYCRWGKESCGNIECFVDTNNPTEHHGYEWFCPNGERRTDEQ